MSTITTDNDNEIQFGAGESGVATIGRDTEGFNSFGTNPRSALARHVITPELVQEADELYARAKKGNRYAMLQFEEALSTSDFKLALFAALDYEIIARYNELPAAWKQYTDETTVANFKPKTLLDFQQKIIGLDKVPEYGTYPAVDKSAGKGYTIAVGKFGNRYQISFEALQNNDGIDEIGDIPAWFAQAAAETEAVTATSNLVTKAGINTGFFKTANGNAPATVALSYTSLEAAINAVKARKVNGRPVMSPKLGLIFPPALAGTVDKIMGLTERRITTGNAESILGNYLKGQVVPIEDPYLSVVNQAASADTTWFLVPLQAARKALWVARMRGHETPEIRVKADGGLYAGGGAVPAGEGSFDIDDVQYRVRHIFGGATGDPIATYASDGTTGTPGV